MDIFILYILMQADNIAASITFCLFLAIFIGVVCAIVGHVDDNDKSKKLSKICAILSVPLLIAAALMPTTKTMAVMIGGHYALDAAKSDVAKKIMILVEKTIDDAISMPNKKDGKK